MIQHFLSVGAAMVVSIAAFLGISQPSESSIVPEPIETIVIDDVVPRFTPGTSPFETLLERIREAASSTATATPKTTLPKPATTTTPHVPFTLTVTPSVESPAPAPAVDEKTSTEALLRGAIVNIICIQGGGLRGSSGSGVVIDPRGIILTVAHVGQNFLLNDYPTKDAGTCTIRTGSPAKNAYAAELVYLSSAWISVNKTTFLEKTPTGTGENDYALLAITKSVTGTPLPSSFTYIPLAPKGIVPEVGDSVGVGSYGAEFLTSSQVRSSLYPSISFAPVNDIFTFGNNAIDVISARAGSAAQEGSSGGAIINTDRKLVGLITTRTVKADLSLRDLQAITMDHIRRSFRKDMGADLDAYLKSSDTTSLIAAFEVRASDLLSSVTKAINAARN